MEELFNGLLSEEIANKLKEILKDVPEPKEEEEVKKVKPKKKDKEATTNNTGEEEGNKEIRVNSLNLAMGIKFLTLVKYTTVSNKDKKTMSKYKNYFMFEDTKSVRKAIEILNILKVELRKEQLKKMEEGNK